MNHGTQRPVAVKHFIQREAQDVSVHNGQLIERKIRRKPLQDGIVLLPFGLDATGILPHDFALAGRQLCIGFVVRQSIRQVVIRAIHLVEQLQDHASARAAIGGGSDRAQNFDPAQVLLQRRCCACGSIVEAPFTVQHIGTGFRFRYQAQQRGGCDFAFLPLFPGLSYFCQVRRAIFFAQPHGEHHLIATGVAQRRLIDVFRSRFQHVTSTPHYSTFTAHPAAGGMA